MKRILITGGNGFVGSNVVKYFLKNTDWEVVNIDKLTYASEGFKRLKMIDNPRFKTFTWDMRKPLSVCLKQELGQFDYILNIASESHVDNSIKDPYNFIQNNIDLCLNVLEFAREQLHLERYIQFSTDEVFGSAPEGVNYKEGDRFNSSNPYSASKASQENICQAYANTYKIPIVITNTMNIIGVMQHEEKYVPMCIHKILKGETITIHSNPTKTKAGTRFYINVNDLSEALLFILTETDEKLHNIDSSLGRFNIVGIQEIDNLTLAKTIANLMGKELKYEMVDFHSSRPGHDLRYAISGQKLKEYGWTPKTPIEQTLKEVIDYELSK